MKGKKRCPYCNKFKVVKIGKRRNKKSEKQLFSCKLCNKKFTVDDGFLKMKYEPNIISDALDLLKKGLSLAMVKNQLQQAYNLIIPRKTILYWSKKYNGEQFDGEKWNDNLKEKATKNKSQIEPKIDTGSKREAKR